MNEIRKYIPEGAAEFVVPTSDEKQKLSTSPQDSSEIPQDSEAEPIITNKEPWEMTYEEFSQEYNRVMEAVARKERERGLDPDYQINYRPITPDEQALLKDDWSGWKEFSRERGFSEEDIAEYERWLTLSGQRDSLPNAINDPWRRNRQDWDKELYLEHIANSQQQGHRLSGEVEESYNILASTGKTTEVNQSPTIDIPSYDHNNSKSSEDTW